MREIIIGAAITLTVTIVGGAVVWWGTEYLSRERGEAIYYSSDYSTSFKSNDSIVGTANVNITNSGDEVAESIDADIEFGDLVSIDDRESEATSGSLLKFEYMQPSNNKVSVHIPSLNPNESLKLSFLLRGPGNFEPVVKIRSKNSLGQKELAETQNSVIYFIPFVAGVIFSVIGLFFAKKVMISWPTWADHNNSAFILIQKKETALAEELLRCSYEDDGFGFYSLVNYALVVGLQGDEQRAMRLFAAAEWWSKGKYQEALIYFNKAVLNFSLNRNDDGIMNLDNALKLSPGRIKSICSVSEYIREAANGDQRINELLSRVKKKSGYKVVSWN